MILMRVLLFSLLGWPPASFADDIRLAVASNFLGPVQAIARAFEQDSGHQVRISSGSTGKLYAQIVNGAPYDLFLAANDREPERLEREDSIISRLLDAADGNRERAEWGIVYIDEIDKLARAGESAHATRDVRGVYVPGTRRSVFTASPTVPGSTRRIPIFSHRPDRTICATSGSYPNLSGVSRLSPRCRSWMNQPWSEY